MSDWCKGAGRGADHDGGCTFCSFKGKPTKHWVVRPHKHRASTKPDDAVDDCTCGVCYSAAMSGAR